MPKAAAAAAAVAVAAAAVEQEVCSNACYTYSSGGHNSGPWSHRGENRSVDCDITVPVPHHTTDIDPVFTVSSLHLSTIFSAFRRLPFHFLYNV